METLHIKPYRTKYISAFPAGRQDDQLHGVRTAKPPGVRAIYLVQNGTRRAFPNVDTFTGMGFDMGRGLHFNLEFMIPDRPDLPAWAGRQCLLQAPRKAGT
eukprot:gene12466-14426_t